MQVKSPGGQWPGWVTFGWCINGSQWHKVLKESQSGEEEGREGGRKEGGTWPGGPLQRNLSAEKREWEQGKGRQQPGFYANVAFPENLTKKMWINVKSWAEINNWSHCPVRCHQTIAEKDGTARWCNAPVKPQNNVENTMETWRFTEGSSLLIVPHRSEVIVSSVKARLMLLKSCTPWFTSII